jgi:hypothetical protein
MYIQLFSFYYPDVSVYLHSLTATLFGVSIEVARATGALLTLVAGGAAGLLLKSVFRARYWWAVVLLLSITPVWFLFSRTAFDPIAMAALYGLTIVLYLFYRYRSVRFIFPTIILGAATFYAYPAGQPAIAVLTLVLLISDWRYHWQNRRFLLLPAVVALLVAIPFFRFALTHPTETTAHLRAVDSYLLKNIPVTEKLGEGASIYLQLLSPGYWFLPNVPDLMRHELKGYGFLPLIELPLLLLGIILSLRHIKESRYRAVLASLLAAPIGAAVADPAIIRELAFIVPATIVSGLGLEWLLRRITGARAIAVTSVTLFLVLALMSVGLLQDAITNGPTWYSDYTLYGMQWGAKQVFQDAVPRLLKENPGVPIYISDRWANGTDVFMRFFKLDETRAQMANVLAWMQKKLPLNPKAIFVMTPDEFESAKSSPKFKSVKIQDTIKYPDGRDGFYIARLAYADNVDQVFASERAAELQPVTETVTIQNQLVSVSHTRLDIGSAEAMFDGDPYTVARGIEANPFNIDIRFSQPLTMRGVTGLFGRADTQATILLYSPNSDQPVKYQATFNNASSPNADPSLLPADLDFDHGPVQISRMSIEILYLNNDENAHVHVFELKFR